MRDENEHEPVVRPPPIPVIQYARPATVQPVMDYGTPYSDYGPNIEPSVWEVLYSPKGRIGRYEYWVKGVLPMILAIVASVLLLGCGGAIDRGGPFSILGLIVFIVLMLNAFYVGFVIQIKRMHDFNVTGWIVLATYLAGFIPYYIGPTVSLGMLIVCGFIKGTDGSNSYGGDPTRRTPRFNAAL